MSQSGLLMVFKENKMDLLLESQNDFIANDYLFIKVNISVPLLNHSPLKK